MKDELSTTTTSRLFRSTFPREDDEGFRTASWVAGVADEVSPYHKTILHALAEAARVEATGCTVLADRESRDPEHQSYREMYHRARRFAGALIDLGVGEGDRVLIVLPTCLDFAAAFFGAQLIRAIPVPGYPPTGLKLEAGLRRLAHIANHAGTKVCLTWKKLAPVIGDLGMRAPRLETIAHVEDLRDHGSLDVRDIRYSSREIAFLQYTSGSTGHPKGVALTHHSLVANIHAIGQALRITREDRYCGWCPLYHDMGLIGQLLFSVYWRIPAVLLSPQAFLARPIRWLRAITEHRATMATAPNFGYALAVRRVPFEQRKELDLSSWRVALNGAEPVSLATIEAFRDAYRPWGFPENAIVPVYGLAEASLAVTFAAPGEPIHCDRVDRRALVQGRAVSASGKGSVSLVSVGKAIPGHGAVVVDTDGEPLPEREVGHVVATGPSLMKGYWQDARATVRVLRDGMLWTGDLGYFADERLFIAGRAKDIILIRGSNYYAEDLEGSAEAVDGVRAGGAVAFGVYDEDEATESVVLVCETRTEDGDGRREIAERVGEAVQEECGVAVDRVVLVGPGTIPKTSSGKRQRSECRRMYLEDRLVPERTGKLRLASVFLRSQAGHFLLHARRLMGRNPST